MKCTWSTDEVAETVIQLLERECVKPDKTFTAQKGREQGFVEAWQFAPRQYAIRYSISGATEHEITDNINDLAKFLLCIADYAVQAPAGI